MKHWHVVQTHSRQEARAAIELARQDFQTYLPILESKPMFPRYLFVRFNRDKDNWGVIRSTRGCIDLLKNGFLPMQVREEVMDAIMAYRPAVEIPPEEEIFESGQKVRIVEGPCAGLEGLFQRDARARTSALLEVLGKRVEIPKKSIRAA